MRINPQADRDQSDGVAHWHAVQTTCRHEVRVAARFEKRNLAVFIPMFRTDRNWKKRPATIVERPLFPSYVFVKIRPADRRVVLGTPGVYSILGNRKQSQFLDDSEIETLKSGLRLVNPEPHPVIDFGEIVKICNGPLSGLRGVLVRKRDSHRVVIEVASVMQAISVDVERKDIFLERRDICLAAKVRNPTNPLGYPLDFYQETSPRFTQKW